jgi:hypothetical protein
MKLQGLTIGGVLVAIGIAGMTAAGCTATASTGTSSSGTGSGGRVPPGSGAIPASCAADSSLSCSADAIGISCPTGFSPDDPTLVCSDPTPAGSSDGFCCVTWVAGGDCAPDGSVSGCIYPSYGFSCTANNPPPDAADASLSCSTPTLDPASGLDLYCCQDKYVSSSSSSTAGGCSLDPSLACDVGSDGVDCTGGANPEAAYSGYICSAPSPQSDGSDGYCCATGFAGSTCVQDPSVEASSCIYPEIGFTCAAADSPDGADPTLSCTSVGSDPATGDSLWCCQ